MQGRDIAAGIVIAAFGGAGAAALTRIPGPVMRWYRRLAEREPDPELLGDATAVEHVAEALQAEAESEHLVALHKAHRAKVIRHDGSPHLSVVATLSCGCKVVHYARLDRYKEAMARAPERRRYLSWKPAPEVGREVWCPNPQAHTRGG